MNVLLVRALRVGHGQQNADSCRLSRVQGEEK
jgi:hypothetical protein